MATKGDAIFSRAEFVQAPPPFSTAAGCSVPRWRAGSGGQRAPVSYRRRLRSARDLAAIRARRFSMSTGVFRRRARVYDRDLKANRGDAASKATVRRQLVLVRVSPGLVPETPDDTFSRVWRSW